MREFSTIQDTSVNLTSRDQMINHLISTTGLPKESVSKLYESYDINQLEQITKEYDSFLENKKTVNFSEIEKIVFDAMNKISCNQNISKIEYKSIITNMILELKYILDKDINSYDALKIIILILSTSNNVSFKKLNKYEEVNKIGSLFESMIVANNFQNLNESVINVDKTGFEKIANLFLSASEAALKNKNFNLTKIKIAIENVYNKVSEKVSEVTIFQWLLMIVASKYGYEKIKPLFESEELSYDDLFESITQSSGVEKKKLEEVSKLILSESKNIPEEKEDFSNKSKSIISKIESILGIKINIMNALKLSAVILALINNKKFADVLAKAETGGKANNLLKIFESSIFDVKENKELFESLRDILYKNNKNWGMNYHLENTYNAIVKYLDDEIVELTNKDNIVTINEKYHWDIISNFVKGKDIEPMYRSIDVIKTLTPDIQTLVYDMMLLIHSYFVETRQDMMFINRNTVLDYENAVKLLYSNISSSREASQISYKNNNEPIENDSNFNTGFDYEFLLDNSKINFAEYPVTLNAALNMLHVIKASTNEFNLKIRKVINIYVTKTLELLTKSEKIMISKKKNQYFYK